MNLETIARLAGVSRSTVSRVVNDDPRVSDAVRARVEVIIRENHFQPNAAARSLASRRTRILGLRIPDAAETLSKLRRDNPTILLSPVARRLAAVSIPGVIRTLRLFAAPHKLKVNNVYPGSRG